MKILIGDDHLLFREGLRRLLEQLSADVLFTDASTFDEVMDICRADPCFDLVLIDLQMPGWPGFGGITELRELMPETPVVVVSASESHVDMRASLDHGAAGFIPKSSSVKIMLSALNLVFSGGIYVPPAAIGRPASTPASRSAAGPLVAPARSGSQERLPFGGASPRGDEITALRTRAPSVQLTQRQWDVLNCLRAGKSNKQIAYELGLSEGTVKIHVTAIFKSLGVRNRTQAVIAATELMAREPPG